MKRQPWFTRLPIIVALTLLAAFFMTTPVYAQDEQPPQPEETPVEVVVDSPAEEGSPAELAPALEAAAESGVTLVDTSGEPLALASEEATSALEGGDPWYKVGTVTYHFLSGVFPNTCANLYPMEVFPYCQQSATPIQAAIDYVPTSGLPSDGMIYVERGTYAEPVTVNALTTPILAGLKGLVSTAPNSKPQADLTGDIYIDSVIKGFTITGFKITANADYPRAGITVAHSIGTLKIEDVDVTNSGGGPGLDLNHHNGVVILNRVTASHNANGGAWIDNRDGTTGVTITNSTFDYNDRHGTANLNGISIMSNGAVLIDGISISHTTGAGNALYVLTPRSLNIKNSVFDSNLQCEGITVDEFTMVSGISLTNVYSTNNWEGMWLYTPGNISLTGVHADGNIYRGAYVGTCNEVSGLCTLTGTGVVTIKNSTFDGNGDTDYGLYVESRGTITLTNVSASDNTNAGANPDGARLYAHYSPLANTVNVTNGVFSGNDGSGLVIKTKGNIVLNKVKADDNGYTGADLDNTFDSVASTVTVTGSAAGDNSFNLNFDKGLYVQSNGVISVKYAQAEENLDYGIHLDNTSGLAFPGVTMTGADILFNGDIGLLVYSKGNVSLTGVRADVNTTSAAYIETCHEDLDWCQWLGPGKVTIKNSTFDDTDDVLDAALYVTSRGAISLTNVSASGNTNYGLRGALLKTLYSQLVSPVTITGSTFNDNEGDSLVILATGAITLNKVKANSNLGWGARLDNQWASSSHPITVNGTASDYNQFSDNDYTGLRITSNGVVSIKYAECSMNGFEPTTGGEGLYIDNTTSTTSSGVTLTSVWGDENLTASGSASFLISTKGAVVINGGHANNNVAYGLLINNSTASDSAPKLVTITNFSANGNRNYGIRVLTKGAITLTSVSANNTTGANQAAISLDNHWLTSGITLTKVNANDNNYAGIELITNGKLTYKGGEVKSNGNHGIKLNMATGYRSTTVALTDLYVYDNDGFGVVIYTQGAVTLTNMRSNNNHGGAGLYVNNTYCGTATPCKVSLLTSGKGVNEFNGNNTGTGLEIATYGQVILIKVSCSGNGIYGANINNADATIPANVTVTSGEFNENGHEGILILSKGVIAISGITVNGNSGPGSAAGLDNTFDTTGAKGITVVKSTFNENDTIGIFIDTYGAVVLNSVHADGNGENGASITNRTPGKPVTILASYGGNTFDNNSNTNLRIISSGAVALTNVTANESLFSDGIYIVNDTGVGTVTLINVTTNSNYDYGTRIYSRGNITINGVTAMFNYGLGGSRAGLYIHPTGEAANKITVSNSIVSCNADYGILIDMIWSWSYKLINVFYFGNNSDNAGNERNLDILY